MRLCTVWQYDHRRRMTEVQVCHYRKIFQTVFSGDNISKIFCIFIKAVFRSHPADDDTVYYLKITQLSQSVKKSAISAGVQHSGISSKKNMLSLKSCFLIYNFPSESFILSSSP